MAEDPREQLDLPQMDQVGFVVRDLEAAMALYTPFFFEIPACLSRLIENFPPIQRILV